MPINALRAEECAKSLRTTQFFNPVLNGTGVFFDRAWEEAKQIQNHWEEIGKIQDLVADVLIATAQAQMDLDFAWEKARTFGDESELVTDFLRHIQAMGEALDAACAAEIDFLCTPAPNRVDRRFADSDSLSIAALHECNTNTAIEQIIGSDGKILELGDGHIVVAYGDIEHSPHVATIVPGVGSSNPEHWPQYADRGRRLAKETGAAIVWLGYQAPPNVPAGITPLPAEYGASELREFQAALARRNPDQYRSILAHSYGTVVAGKAAQSGLAADAIIFMGSPGTGVNNSSELHLYSDEPRIIAITGDRDPIALSASATDGVHGPDPTHPQFGAEVWHSQTDHSGYWEDQTFLHQISQLPYNH